MLKGDVKLQLGRVGGRVAKLHGGPVRLRPVRAIPCLNNERSSVHFTDITAKLQKKSTKCMHIATVTVSIQDRIRTCTRVHSVNV